MRVEDLSHSSFLKRMLYDEDRNELTLEFQDGEIYRYFLVPASICDGLAGAESAGSFFSTYIRGRYPDQLLKGVFDP
jgi:hypothetical protein